MQNETIAAKLEGVSTASSVGPYWDKLGFTKKKLLLQVPSALVEDEYNILINPDHPDIRYVKIKKIQKYHFDQRLLK